MHLSCLPVSLFGEFLDGRLDIGKWAVLARGIGFDGFDISSMFIKNHTATYLDETRRQIDASGIPLVMVTSYPDFTHPDAAQRRRELSYLETDMALTAQLGGKFLRVLAGQNHPGLERARGVASAVECLRKAAKAAREFGVVLVYENHAKPGAWHYIDFSFPPDIFLDVFNGISDTGIMVNFDIGNATAEFERPGGELELLEKVVDKVATVHVCDMRERGKFTPTLLGTGKTPVGQIFSYLKKRGFAGWLCIEEAGNQGIDGARKAHAYAVSAWENA
ncbi:MAG: sugar phosphate isomerase/epimerase [Planctomycetota bacterium]|jgi:sugar phosphate isomerase/epimerase|nr:sugar phosphate isomerase/epimerase [Planctomycetota bacterium]